MSEPIVKKVWPELFQLMLDGKKNVDVRLADFRLEEGDEILFREYLPAQNRYTGRSILRKVKTCTHVNFTDFNTIDDIKKHGHYVMELEGVSK